MAADELSVKISARDELSGTLKDVRAELKKSIADLGEYGKHLDTVEGKRAYDEQREQIVALSREEKRLVSQTAKATREINEMAKAGTKSAGKLTSAWKKAGKVFQNDLVAGISAGALVLFGKQAVQAFARVEDSTAALTSTFGDAGQAMTDWANSSADAFNLSKAEALDAQLAFANFAKAAGMSGEEITKFSIDLVERAADMASYFGGTVTDAIQAIQSGLMGQAEPLRRYSVLLDDASLRVQALSMGLIDNVKTALTPQNKVLAANALILKQTSQVQGDVARTSDSMGNKIKDAQQQFADFQSTAGETISVALSPLLGLLNGAMDAFNGLSTPVKSVAIAIGLLGTAALIATPRIVAMNTALEGQGGLLGVTKSLGSKGKGAMAAAAAGVLALGAAARSTDTELFRFGARSEDFASNMDWVADAAARTVQGGAGNAIANGFGTVLDAIIPVETQLEADRQALTEFDQKLVEVATTSPRQAQIMFDGLARRLMDQGLLWSDIVDLLPGYTAATRAANGSTSAFASTVAWAMGGTEEYAGSLNLLAQANRNADAAARGLNGALQGVNDTIARNQAMRAYEEALAAFVKKPTQEAGEAVELAMTNAASTFKKPEKAAKFVTEAVDEIGAAVKDADLPPKIKTALTDPLETADKKAHNVLDTANAINAFKPKAIDFVVTVNGQPVASAADARAAARGTLAFAAGGEVTPGALSLVGEVGPELFVPQVGPMKVIGADGPELRRFDQPGYVIPNHLVPAVASGTATVSGGGATVNIGTIQATSGVDVEGRVLHALLRADRIKRERG